MFGTPAIERRHFSVLVGEQQAQNRSEGNASIAEQRGVVVFGAVIA